MQSFRSLLLGAVLAAPLAALAAPADQGLNVDWLDKSVDPAQDFYHFANGGWQKANPIPAEYSDWGAFDVLNKHNQEVVRGILEEAAADKEAKAGSELRKVGDFYATGMDEAAIDKAGLDPLLPEFKRIAQIQGTPGLIEEIAHLQMIGVNAVFFFGQTQDLKDSSKVIGTAIQGGLGLPDRDYYLKDDQRFKDMRAAYQTHLLNMFNLLGDSVAASKAEAQTVMRIETGLAQASMNRVDRRNPDNVYHPMSLGKLTLLTPSFEWDKYFAAMGHPELTGINVAQPDFFKVFDEDLTKVPLADWKTYLRWHLIHDYAPYLSKPFVDENFKLTSAITGAKELLPRWQRVLNEEDGDLGFAVGKLYVAKAFPPASRKQVLDILHAIRAALKDDLSTLAWMSPATRKAALKKLDLMQERIGYPDKWRDYGKLDIKRDSYALNVMRANEFEEQRQLAKIGKPVDTSEWGMTPPTVNAYYSPQRNNINFPAGILQPPFFDPAAPMAVNFGALGFVMGHEITHGFDDQGARFDGHGNHLAGSGWWTEDDYKKFQAATGCISDHFSAYTVVDPNTHVQGKLVTGEATADLGGLTLAWRALHNWKGFKRAKTIDGFTPDQQFFLGAAHVWADNIRDQQALQYATIDPHPPALYRVNGTLANMPEFQQAFHVPDGSPMVNKVRCVIW